MRLMGVAAPDVPANLDNAHAYIRGIDAAEALAAPGVHLVLTYEDSPAHHYSTARHEHATADPAELELIERVGGEVIKVPAP